MTASFLGGRISDSQPSRPQILNLLCIDSKSQNSKSYRHVLPNPVIVIPQVGFKDCSM